MRSLFQLLVILLGIAIFASPQANAKAAKDVTIILVHGAWADGSSWSKVTPRLQHKGYQVVAVQNPLTSLEDDVAVTQRAIDAAPGSVVLVGHSYGGAVISQVGASDKVKTLVFVAAFAPDVGQAVGELGTDLPPAPGAASATPDAEGFIRLSEASFMQNFAGDLRARESRAMSAAQGPTAAKDFGTKLTSAAWKTKSNYYVVSQNDRMIQPDLERQFAKAMNAKTTEVAASHAVMVSHPREVAKVILEAANAVQ